MDIWDTIATERLRLAGELEALSAQQWATQSQCEAWTVKDVAAHLVVPFEVSTPKFLFTFLKNGRSLDKTMIELTGKFVKKNSTEDIVDKLRANAAARWTPPGRGAEIPLSEIVVHGQDIRQVLDMQTTVPSETVALALEGIDDPEINADYVTRIGLPVNQAD